MRKILYLIVGLICALPVKSQPDCLFTHYSSEEGLSQNTVMCILQDRKGNMWFATWDGINKFNGYVFRTYKAKFDNRINLTNNRADHMYEDKYGFLWLQTYDNQVYRFDTCSETFESVPATEEKNRPTESAPMARPLWSIRFTTLFVLDSEKSSLSSNQAWKHTSVPCAEIASQRCTPLRGSR